VGSPPSHAGAKPPHLRAYPYILEVWSRDGPPGKKDSEACHVGEGGSDERLCCLEVGTGSEHIVEQRNELRCRIE
jgi:hypothetical protein